MMALCQNLLTGCALMAIYVTTPASSVQCPAYYTYYSVKYYHYCSGVCCDYSIPTACCVWVYRYKPSHSYSSSRYSRVSGYSRYSSPYSGYSDYSSSYDTYSDSNGGLSGGAIAGIVIGSIVGFTVLMVIVGCICSSSSSKTKITPTAHNPPVYPRTQINTVLGNVVEYNPSRPPVASGFVVQKTRIVEKTRVTLKPPATKHV